VNLTLPTVTEILQEFNYDSDSGVFRDAYAKKGRKRKDNTAGAVYSNGYLYLRINGKRYLAHRIAWKLLHGFDPPKEVDHKDTNRLNNRAKNLRLADESEQSRNSGLSVANTSGYKGVSFNAKKKRWVARIRVGNTYKHLAMSKDPKIAHDAYCAAARRYFGEFANDGTIRLLEVDA
jgi:hypothetical protein